MTEETREDTEQTPSACQADALPIELQPHHREADGWKSVAPSLATPTSYNKHRQSPPDTAPVGTYAATYADHAPEGERLPTTHEVILPLFSPAAQQPTKRYRTIVADPPWRYNSKLVGLRGATDYPTMTQEDLMGMPVGLWAGKDAHLYLWTTDAFMVQAHHIAAAWGFEVKNVLVWVKGRDEQRLHIGVGFYFRHACEYILFGVRGSQSVNHHDQPNVFFAPRTGHSEKPAAFYDMVQRMSPGPYLDVFARKQRFGWDTWGDEAFDFRTHGIWHNEVAES